MRGDEPFCCADPTMPPLLHVRGLNYNYPDGTAALAGIDLDVTAGERLALVGPNGSGKTTLIKQLCGLLAPTAGQVFFKGKALAGKHLEQSRLSMGLLFQDPDDQLFGHTLLDDVCFGLRQQGCAQLQAQQIALHTLARVDLADMAYKAPHNLSLGQKKRAALAGLLVIQPDVLLLDEPTANLDPLQEEQLLRLLLDFRGALVCVSHDLLFLYALCQRAVVLGRGAIQHDQPLQELVSHRHSLREHGLDFSFRLDLPADEKSPIVIAEAADDLGPRPTVQPDSKTPDLSHDRSMAPALIELRNWRYTYPDGTRALSDIDLELAEGQRVAIVGENGAGKSTLLACLLGLYQGEGSYRFDGTHVTRKTRKKLWQDIQMVFQDSADQLFCATVREEVTFGLRQLRLPQAEIRRRLEGALALVKLEGFAERVPLHLSGGERKRLALACVLAMQPRLIILDEPTAGLDPQGEELLLNILRDLPGGLLLVSHDLFFVRELTRRVLVLHRGSLRYDLPVVEFIEGQRLNCWGESSVSYRLQSAEAIRKLQAAGATRPQ